MFYKHDEIAFRIIYTVIMIPTVFLLTKYLHKKRILIEDAWNAIPSKLRIVLRGIVACVPFLAFGIFVLLNSVSQHWTESMLDEQQKKILLCLVSLIIVPGIYLFLKYLRKQDKIDPATGIVFPSKLRIVLGSIVPATLSLALGIAVLIYSISQHCETKHWTEITATVISSHTWVFNSSDAMSAPMGIENRDSLKVRYKILNTEYISERMVWYGTVISQFFDKNTRFAILGKCVDGTQTTVYYNPKNPYEFVLERGSLQFFPGRSWISILFTGVILTSISLVLLICFMRGDFSLKKMGFAVLFVILVWLI